MHSMNHSPLVEALLFNQLDQARRIAEQRQEDLNRHDATGRSPLDYCVPIGKDYRRYNEEDEERNYGGVTVKAKILLDFGADVNLQDRAGWTALHQCAWNGHLPLLQLLVTRGGDVSIRNTEGYQPLDLAVIRGHAPLVRYLEVQSGSLRCQCRKVIHESLGERCLLVLNQLPLPTSLKLFLNHDNPYPGGTAPVVIPRPWEEERVRSGRVGREEVQQFIEEHANEQFLEERGVRRRQVGVEELAEMLEALYFWEAFKEVEYEEPPARPPRYSMNPNRLTRKPLGMESLYNSCQ